MPPAGVENPVRGEGCARPEWRSQTPGPGLVRAGASDGWYRKSPSQAHPRSASGLRSSWKLQGLGRMVGPQTKGSLRPFPEAPWAALGVCGWGWRDKDQGQAPRPQPSTHKPVGHLRVDPCSCSHTRSGPVRVFFLHVFVGHICVAMCMHVHAGPARWVPGSVSPPCV